MEKDISLENISLIVTSQILLQNTNLKISDKHKYGLIGHNGSGKTTLMKNIMKNKQFKIPKGIDRLYVEQEVASDPKKTVFETVLEANRERILLLKKLADLEKKLENSHEYLDDYNKTHEKLNNVDAYKDEPKVRIILEGLGFNKEEQDSPTNKFSGGWRMRISLARALYMEPTLLMLDEPTNHLDLNAVFWLTDYLIKWKKTLLIVSHDKNFLNEICTDIIHLENKKLTYYKGNYDKFLKGYDLYLRNLEKEWKKVNDQVKLLRKKNTPKKDVDKYIEQNKDKEPQKPYRVKMFFPGENEIGKIESNIVEIHNVTFGYSQKEKEKVKILFENVNFGCNSYSRIVIVGKNGVGKSTLIKLILKEYEPIKGEIKVEDRARIGYYHQHSNDYLPLEETPIEYISSLNKKLKEFDVRRYLGSIGLPGNLHNKPIKILSGGQKARVVFVSLFVINPHLIILDEPTNHLDIETIDALVEGLNSYNGGVIMVTHNIDLIEQTNCTILEIDDKKLVQHEDLDSYYDKVMKEIYKDQKE